MKLYDFGTTIVITVVVLCAGYFIVKEIKPDIVEDDNAIEECLEYLLENRTGVVLDLTPYSPEENARLEEDARIIIEYSDEVKI